MSRVYDCNLGLLDYECKLKAGDIETNHMDVASDRASAAEVEYMKKLNSKVFDLTYITATAQGYTTPLPSWVVLLGLITKQQFPSKKARSEYVASNFFEEALLRLGVKQSTRSRLRARLYERQFNLTAWAATEDYDDTI